MKPLRVLLDTSVLRRGHFATGAIKTQRLRWGDAEIDSKIPGFTKRPDHKDEWTQRQIQCIPTIARLISDGVIKGYKSKEIQFELIEAYNEPRIGNVFRDAPLKEARVPVYRSRFIQGGYGATFGKEGLLHVCRSLRDLDPERANEILSMPLCQDHFDEFESDSLRSIGIFHSVSRNISEKHLVDA